jgi:hypothetical protein
MIITQVATVCAWCNAEQGKPQGEGTHGICSTHARVEYEKYQASRVVHTRALPAIQPVYGTCGHLAKSPQYSCGSPRCSQYSW